MRTRGLSVGEQTASPPCPSPEDRNQWPEGVLQTWILAVHMRKAEVCSSRRGFEGICSCLGACQTQSSQSVRDCQSQYTCVCACACLCVPVCAYACVHVCLCMCTCMCMCVFVCAPVCFFEGMYNDNNGTVMNFGVKQSSSQKVAPRPL